jgi:SOS response associated peptidase (SRAP)
MWLAQKAGNNTGVRLGSMQETAFCQREIVVVADVHNRMPVILHQQAYDLWLDSNVKDHSLVPRLLNPFDASRMKKYPVSTRVNHPENDDPECAHEAMSRYLNLCSDLVSSLPELREV